MNAAPIVGALGPGSVLDRPRPADVPLDDLVEIAETVRHDTVGLRASLTRVLRDPVALEALAARSYLHANGFAKIVLYAPEGADVKVRLHVWEDGAGPELRGESDPHGHRWRFVSTVVAGTGLDVVHLAETGPEGQGESYERYGYDPRGGPVMIHERTCRLQVVETSHRGPHDIYRCDTDVVHTIEPADRGLVATVVVQGPDRTPSTPVYRRSPDPSVLPRLPLAVDVLVRFLEPLLDELGPENAV